MWLVMEAGAHCNISAATPSSPGARPIFIFLMALRISWAVGVSPRPRLSTIGGDSMLRHTLSETGEVPFWI